jgi:DNA-binding beta-propeller fold protein YncE
VTDLETAPQTERIARYVQTRRKRGKVLKLALLVLLVLVLMLLVWSAMYYAANRRLPFPAVDTTGRQALAPPEFLYAISGPEGADALQEPVGVAVTADDKVFVVDGKNRVVRCYTTDGAYLFSFSAITSDKGDALQLPARVAIGPDGNVWVTDRRLRSIFVFSAKDGSFVREFVPKSDITETWGPLALAFDAKGDLYVADVGKSRDHRIVAFDSEGNEIARWGTTAKTANIMESPGGFHYPNGIAFSKAGEVYVSDMSNRRIQVFSPEGEFKRIIATSGSPLGIVIDSQERLCVVDPFAHSIDVYKLDGTRLTGFGGPGLALGRFQFPSDIALDETGRMFISDRENDQVQVWGWPTGLVPPIVLPKEPVQWALCLSPLLLLLIPLARRRTAFMTTPDFIEAMIASGSVPAMDQRRFKWIVTEAVYNAYVDRGADGVRFEYLLSGQPYSRTDVEDFMEKTGTDEATAIVLTMAERTGRLATEDRALAEQARALGVTVVDRQRFMDEYAARRPSSAARREGGKS